MRRGPESPQSSTQEHNDLGKQMEKIARENFSAWNAALQTGDAKVVAELYSEDNTFHPTMLGELRTGQAGAKEYFENHFLKKEPKGEIVQEVVQVISPNDYVHSGMYNFEVNSEDKREKVEARFTFIWRKDKDGHWKIIHHHSSVKPH